MGWAKGREGGRRKMDRGPEDEWESEGMRGGGEGNTVRG